MQYLNEKILKAFQFAAIAHTGQKRKDPFATPYFSHPAAVAMVLARAGFSDELVMAGALHDTIEDATVTLPQLQQEFGDHVAELVFGVTEDKKLPWAERKKAYNESIAIASDEVKILSAADLLANCTSLLLVLQAGVNPWPSFSKDPKEYVQRVRAVDRQRLACIKENFYHPLVDELEKVMGEVEKLTDKLNWN